MSINCGRVPYNTSSLSGVTFLLDLIDIPSMYICSELLRMFYDVCYYMFSKMTIHHRQAHIQTYRHMTESNYCQNPDNSNDFLRHLSARTCRLGRCIISLTLSTFAVNTILYKLSYSYALLRFFAKFFSEPLRGKIESVSSIDLVFCANQ